ncbi:MAG: hypothetical protein JWL61_2941 [Gemmatimonadetes bacterium]|nr:hypothetical protein [Gemmatimonadota bacterium]
MFAATLTGACASSGAKGTSAEGGCALRPQDSTFAMHMPLYRDCAVERKVQKITPNIAPDWQPNTSGRGSGCYSAEVEFVVTADGKPDATTARVVRTNTPALAEAVLAVIPRFKYEPAKRDGVAVAQITTEKFELMTRVVSVPAGTRPSPSNMGRPGLGC